MSIKREKRWTQVKARMEANTRRLVARATLMTVLEVRKTLNQGASSRGRNPSPPGMPPHRDTGTLAKSWQPNFTRLNEPMPRGRAGSNLPYAKIHETGGTITAKGKALPVPLNQEARDLLRRKGGSLRNVPGLFVLRMPSGKALLGRHWVRVRGKARKWSHGFKALFVLKRSVRIPRRPYVLPTMLKVRPKIVAMFKERGIIGGLT